jgi:hypothetical protein
VVFALKLLEPAACILLSAPAAANIGSIQNMNSLGAEIFMIDLQLGTASAQETKTIPVLSSKLPASTPYCPVNLRKYHPGLTDAHCACRDFRTGDAGRIGFEHQTALVLGLEAPKWKYAETFQIK